MTGRKTNPVGLIARLMPGRSIKRRMVLVFLLLAVALAGVFIVGAQRAFTLGWREAARPVLMDYIDRLAGDVAGQGEGPPSVERAQALTQRLPLTVHIEGPVVQWRSHPEPDWRAHARARDRGWEQERWGGDKDWERMLQRRTADGHVIRFGLNEAAFERRQRHFGVALVALLLITLGAYLYVRRLLRPLDDIRAGARRFGAGDFGQPIPVRHPGRPDELGQLAATVNTMGHDIHQMLEAKRALLLAISHELRSPITRARLHAELLPEEGEAAAQRTALLRDLQEMADLVSDLLESERLAGGHAGLNREPVDLPALARDVVQELSARHARAVDIALQVDGDLSNVNADRARLRLLLRNLLDNAWRHGGDAPQPPELLLSRTPQGVTIEVRDHGPGVPDEQLAQLAQAFYRPDSARTRAAGGVGLGLYLCRLVAQAHGGRLVLENARPGLRVRVELPQA
ncbi:MAG TPA: HAMP domain-containing sensor histidine kinase [Hydrogenophaga sp.]|uniref:HAMP domain-containing sensor histidine kinase n=1 Tax=Hydrogenophaga sp. TaxID=1904254 RepID=UPI002BB95926|nr:HAMP domain-containing sensor histidine kinase [Hydrogenophaga sp.]HMN91713.1 HAMP domain-containing sensor histidine kinase [Hydrogenophaga sp.]HMP10569.1 HAMP domain-containing sensor histidine kinase [Hydrogenophaga sp.]